MFQKELTGRPKSDVPLGGASDAFEAEHLYELECIEDILLRSNSRTQRGETIELFWWVGFGRRWDFFFKKKRH